MASTSSPFPPAGSVTAAHAASAHPPPVKDSFQRLVDGMQSLFREHLALARLELREDVKAIVKDAALSAAGVPLLFVGYVLLMAAFGFLLARVVPDWAAFGIVALVNIGAGAALAVIFGKRIGKQDKLEMTGTADELQRDKAWVASLREGTRPQPIPGALATTQSPALAPRADSAGRRGNGRDDGHPGQGR